MKLPKPYIAVLFNWNKEKLSADIVYFHLREGKDKSFITYTRLNFTYEKDYLRVYKYMKIGKNSNFYMKPRAATEDLKEAEYLIIPDTDLPWDNKAFLEYCTTFKISKARIATLCRTCLERRYKWTNLEKDSVLYKGQRICEYCSKKELTQELQRSNLVVSGGLTKFYQQQALRGGNLDEVLENISFGSEQDPFNNPNSTLFDTIKSVKQEKSLFLSTVKEIPSKLRNLLISEGIKTLLPIQEMSIDKGLLTNNDLLVVAGTTSGKTLVGEIAGITKALQKKKFVYLSPLVALTNQKYEQFRKRYKKIGLKTAVRVGMSRIKVEGEFNPIIDDDAIAADIIVATYEAFDFLLRDGRSKNLGDIGVIVIDEVQMLVSEGRGFRLNGLIARLKALFPRAQFVYLSATIGNPDGLATDLKAETVLYLDRPIPLERHAFITENEEDRFNKLSKLCRNEEKIISSTGFKGQILVFTNSRRNCEKLAKNLKKKGILAAFYHAGLTFRKRKIVEKGFEKRRYSTVVTTIALGAGVDFPASTVIFENLAMGINWLTVAEFHQMLGRAGRLGYHDLGKVYLLVEPGRKLSFGQKETEEQIAFELLTKPIEDVDPILETIEEEEEILATIVSFQSVNISQDKMIFANILGRTSPLSENMNALKKMKMIYVENKTIFPTKLGKAVSLSFLAPSYAIRLVQEIQRAKKKELYDDLALTLAVKIQPFKSAHLSPKIHGEIERVIKSTISTNIFSGTVLDLYSGNSWGTRNPTQAILETFTKWTSNIFSCKCLDRPFCECGEINFSKMIFELRQQGYSPSRIAEEMRKENNIQLYPGDVYSWLDSLVHHLQAIQRLADVMDKDELKQFAQKFAKQIENPKGIADKSKK
ncbi:MAG: DEAD/DEAH box helicase [Candidatus Heimdallarchaeota archaeon]|nr:DEAD/DEAH box helicase [Candidatus Heimdallarchaeota archaeon]